MQRVALSSGGVKSAPRNTLPRPRAHDYPASGPPTRTAIRILLSGPEAPIPKMSVVDSHSSHLSHWSHLIEGLQASTEDF